MLSTGVLRLFPQWGRYGRTVGKSFPLFVCGLHIGGLFAAVGAVFSLVCITTVTGQGWRLYERWGREEQWSVVSDANGGRHPLLADRGEYRS